MDDNTDKGLSRRQLLGLGAAVAGGAAAAPLLGAGSSASADPPAYPLYPAGTTLAATMLHGAPNASGYRKVVAGPGEPSVLRGDLLGTAVRNPSSANRRPLVALTQLTDIHIVDAQSPARVEFLDRLDDPGSPLTSLPFQAAYRPNEMLSAHVGEATVQAVNAVHTHAPVTGRPIDFTICTGDNMDNTQYNELRLHIDILDGKTVRPDSGNLTKWEGVGGPTDLDTAYWHPDGTPRLGSPDKAHASFGFPTVPGLLNSCRQPFKATGVNGPWYTVFGNHDGLVQGNVPSLGIIGAVATGAVKVTGLPTGLNLTALLAEVAGGNAAAFATLLTAGPAKVVTADKNRRMLNHKQTVTEYFNTTGTPVGHGYTSANVATNTAYYTFEPAPNVHCIVLDTCDTNGLDTGSIDKTQLAWLTNQLTANSSRHLDASGNWVSTGGHDKVILIFSHHTVATMTNSIGLNRVQGPAVASLLLQYPNVVAWVNGHTHRNTVTAHARSGGAAPGSGFWEINTAAHIDWPEQARVVEVVDNGDGTMSVFGTIIDHAAPLAWPTNPTTPLELAALSRELGMNDWQRDPETTAQDGKRGAISDRNVELLVAAPFVVP